MITELQVEGFKSFGAPSPPLSLGRLNFVVGANASGKSNLITALRFLQNAVLQNVEYAANELGGVTEVRNKILRQRNKTKPVRFVLKVKPEDDKTLGLRKTRLLSTRYEVEIDLRSDDKSPSILSETLEADIERDNKRQHFLMKRDAREVTIVDPTSGSTERRSPIPVPTQEMNRLALGVGFYAMPAVVLRSEIQGWRFFNIAPNVARQPSKELPELALGSAGENLAVVLHQMQKQDGVFKAIERGLRGAVPGFKTIKTKQLPVEGKWAFQVVEEKIRGAINPASVSDGTIRLLALLVITVWTSKRSTLVAIEEPENGVHPHLSEYIVEILRTASKERQMIVTTHNPDFLDHLEPEEVYLCDKVSGFTKIKRASDVTEIGTFKKHFRLGELWIQGKLGGIL